MEAEFGFRTTMLAPKCSRTCLSEASVDLPEHLHVPVDMILPRASYMYVYLIPPSLLSYLFGCFQKCHHSWRVLGSWSSSFWRPGSTSNKKNLHANAGDARDAGSAPGSGRFPWSRKWQPTPVFLPGESHGQRSLVGYCPWGGKKSDTTEHTEIIHTQSNSTAVSCLPTRAP